MCRLPLPNVPHIAFWDVFLRDAIQITIITYVCNLSMARLLASKHGYQIDTNQVTTLWIVFVFFLRLVDIALAYKIVSFMKSVIKFTGASGACIWHTFGVTSLKRVLSWDVSNYCLITVRRFRRGQMIPPEPTNNINTVKSLSKIKEIGWRAIKVREQLKIQQVKIFLEIWPF